MKPSLRGGVGDEAIQPYQWAERSGLLSPRWRWRSGSLRLAMTKNVRIVPGFALHARRYAWIIAFFTILFPLYAHAFQALEDDPARIARMHCQLWRYTMGDPRPLDFAILDEMAGDDGYTSNLSDSAIESLWRDGAGLPDFGFLVGDRWRVATREDRKNVNAYAAVFLRRHYRLAAPERFEEGSYRDACRIRLSLSLLNLDAGEGSENDVLARAETGMLSMAGEPVTIAYILIKHPPELWRIVDIEIDGESLAASWRSRWVGIIAESGFGGLVRHLTASSVPPTHREMPPPQ